MLSWSGIVFWSLLKKRVKKWVKRSIPFFWIITYGTMPVITGTIWKEFHFIEHVAYIIDPKKTACIFISHNCLYNFTLILRESGRVTATRTLITQSHLKIFSWHITRYSQIYPFSAYLVWYYFSFLWTYDRNSEGTLML